jgi:hypothetical protein
MLEVPDALMRSKDIPMEAVRPIIPPPVDLLAGDLGLDRLPALEPGETLLWTGRPNAQGFAGVMLSFYIAYVFSLACCGGLFVGTQYLGIVGIAAPEPDMSRLIAAALFVASPVLGVVLGVAFQLAWQSRCYRRTRYALTNRRAVAVRPNLIRGVVTKVYPADGGLVPTIVELELDGSGSLVFLYPNRESRRGLKLFPGVFVGDGFENISQITDVLRQVHGVFGELASPSQDSPKKPLLPESNGSAELP